VNGDDKAAIEMRQKALQDAYTNIMQAEQSQQQAQSQAGQQQGHAGNDKSAIEMRQSSLQEAYSKLMQAEQAQQQQTGQHQSNAANDGARDEDVIDADFEDVSNG
jgi:molecular chaperone DnaK